MDPIRSLQSRAAQKRDHAIAEARRQYRKDIEAIDALSRQLPAPPPPIDRSQPLGKPPTIMDLIKAVLPADKPFTVSDVMHLLHDAYHGQKFRHETVRTHTSKLCSRGHLRRLYKTGHMETMYVLADAPVNDGPIETKGLVQVAHDILSSASHPMKVSEIAARMKESGYRADNVPNTLMRAIRDMFKRYPGRFERGKDGRWVIVAADNT